MFKYLSYDLDLEFDSPLDIVASEYCDAVLLGATFRAAMANSLKVPIGFARHDDPVIILCPNA